MKSAFILAFNEICEERGLSKDDVFNALETALVSAYRRDMGVSASQNVEVTIDPHTGAPTVYAEKEVTDEIYDNRTEILLAEAHAQGLAEAKFGDLVMADSTTESFGRIAAQTAKQVLLQRVREAEREHLFEDFSEREGELVNGTVQSISGQHVTIGLGRTEAILPRSQQVRRERYRAHDKIRVYVLEVRRTNRGPQIFVSRNHRNLLRRLLELEVPEIYNGQVELKSIAREAGQRSKIAVQALQPGVDPVGACVGMRGVRIQSIVRELNDEKIDVIEWNPDQTQFIAKALSPARVTHVFLEDHPDKGKTAAVIVPDDQLSLAIGREGQNARLAAKLTGWRIDIKSLTEAAIESLTNLNHNAADPAIAKNKELQEKAQSVLDKKEAGRPITSEDYRVLSRVVYGVEGKIIATRVASYEEVRRRRVDARKQVPSIAWTLPLVALDLPGRAHNLLLDNKVETVGDVLYYLAMGDKYLLDFNGFGEKTLNDVKAHVLAFEFPVKEGAEEDAATVGEMVVTAVSTTTISEDKPDVSDEAIEEIAEEETEDTVEDTTDEADEKAVEEDEDIEEEPVDAIDDLSKSLVDTTPKPKKKKKPKPSVIIARKPRKEIGGSDDDDDDDDGSRKGKSLVFDEKLGEIVTKRKRKRSRQQGAWDVDNWDEF